MQNGCCSHAEKELYEAQSWPRRSLALISAQNIVLSYIGEFGITLLDTDMIGALFSAWQSQNFKMPNLKVGRD